MKKTLSLLLLTGLVSGGWLLHGQLAIRPALADSPSSPDAGYVAHEWGTFTGVQGSDGMQMYWNPAIAPDLPKFVYKTAGGGPSLKNGMITRQRMETPVLYFYSDRERTVDVSINFPQGLITEWYPGKSAADPAFRMPGVPTKKPSLHWDKVKMITPSPAGEAALPKESLPTNYYAARETDASLLQVQAGDKTETEKFLFYRGVASFEAPLTVKMEPLPSTRVILQNKGKDPLKHLFLYQVTAEGGTWLRIPALAAGETRTVALPEIGGAPFSELAASLRSALVSEGLYKKEAAAMVKTWESAWFAERGLRVLYTLPQAWTDSTLPLQLAPAAQQVERVMVARAEIIAPSAEKALTTLMETYMTNPTRKSRDQVLAEVRSLDLGRFLDPAMTLVIQKRNTPEFATSCYEVLNLLRAPAVSPAVVATTR